MPDLLIGATAQVAGLEAAYGARADETNEPLRVVIVWQPVAARTDNHTGLARHWAQRRNMLEAIDLGRSPAAACGCHAASRADFHGSWALGRADDRSMTSNRIRTVTVVPLSFHTPRRVGRSQR